MSSFYGTYSYSLDTKGRLAIPADIRRQAGDTTTYYLVPGFEGCIALYTESGWARIEERLRRQPKGGRKLRAFKRALLMHATRVTVDAQGRITIPSALIDRAALRKEAVLLGQDTHVEIWNPERLDRAVAEADKHFEDLAEDVFD